MDKYEKYFGTKKKALMTLYALGFDCAKYFEKSEAVIENHFFSKGGMYMHNVKHLKKWSDWLDSEVEEDMLEDLQKKWEELEEQK